MFQNIMYVIITGSGIGILSIFAVAINSYIKDANLKIIIEAIETAVGAVAQTYVDALKKDGKFDQAAQDAAKEKAIEIVKQLIGENGEKYIAKLYGNFSVYVSAKIEQIIKKSKETTVAVNTVSK